MDPLLKQHSGQSFSYSEEANSESKNKKYKAEILRENPETLKADFTVINRRETKADLLFYTEHPDVCHSTLLADNKHFKMCGNKTLRQLY